MEVLDLGRALTQGVTPVLGDLVFTAVFMPVVVLQAESDGRRRDDPGAGTVLSDEKWNPDFGEIARADVHDEPLPFERLIGWNTLGHGPFEGLSAKILKGSPEDELRVTVVVRGYLLLLSGSTPGKEDQSNDWTAD